MRILSFALVFCAVALRVGSALAEDQCPPLTMITSVDMQIGADGRIYVPAKINDVRKSMLVDTGGFFTEITEPLSLDLKLTVRHTGLELVGIAGDTTRLKARAGLTLGRLHDDSMDFMVMPDVHTFAPDVPDAAGLIAPNLLRAYDLDLDFGGRKLNLISQKHCDGKVIYWPASAVAVVPMRVNPDGHIWVPVELDGHRVTAMLDTGASRSVLNLGTAKNMFGLEAGSADTPAEGSFGGGNAAAYSHRFKSLALEGIAISNPKLTLLPDLMRGKLANPHDNIEGDTRIPDAKVETGLGDMILGMDILRHLHVYIAYKEQKLYLTPATASAVAGAPATAAASAAPAK
jgi:predicted aspartyl protease